MAPLFVSALSRSWLIDALKAFASQLIVWHHLALYAPSSPVEDGWFASLRALLSDHGRLAVPIFLVVAGYLAAHSLAPLGEIRTFHALSSLKQRWWRLAPTYWITVILCVAACHGIRAATQDLSALPDAPTLGELIVNLLMLQDILSVPAVSAGLWYVAIDLQLFGSLALLLTLGRTRQRTQIGYWLVVGLTAASLWVFNLDPAGDIWAPYFFGAYGLGALAAWHTPYAPRSRRTLGLIIGLSILALLIDWRPRIAIACITALVLARWGQHATHHASRLRAGLATLSKLSYAVFLTHFTAVMLCFALIPRDWTLANSAAALTIAWLAGLALGALVHHGLSSAYTRSTLTTRLRARLLRQRTTWLALSSPPGREAATISTTLAAPPTRSS